MLYPVGWLAPEVPSPSPHPPVPEVLSALLSSQPSSPRQRPQVKVALAENSPRWAMGKHHLSSSPLASVASPPRSAETAGLGKPTATQQGMVLRQGSQGDAVLALQARLQRLGYDPGPLDGFFGPRTEQAVRQFQQASHIAVDGVVGTLTWRYLVPNLPLAADPSRPIPSPQDLTSALPTSAQSLPNHLGLHSMAVLPEAPRLQIVGIVVLSLGLVGLVGHLGFRPDAALRPRPSSASASDQPIYTPQPIYPAHSGPSHSTGSTGSHSAASVANSVVSRPSALNPPVPHPSVPNPTIPNPAAPAHLPDFVYDLLQPYGRHQLEVLLQGGVTGDAATAATPQPTPLLAALLQRIGVFPERNYRTGSPYTYLLLDDVGGCFRLCGNELWLTHIVHQWFQPDVAYTAIIRRIDTAGQVLDKEFTVALSRQQWAQVA